MLHDHGLLASATLLHALPSADAPATDPVIAVIATCRAAVAEANRLHAICADLPDAAPEWRPQAAAHAYYWRLWKETVLTTTPRTAEGARALAAYAIEFRDEAGADLDEGGPQILALIAASPMLGGPAPARSEASTDPHPDADLLALDREWRAAHAAHAAASEAYREAEEAAGGYVEMPETLPRSRALLNKVAARIAAVHARTMAGVLVKARVAQDHIKDEADLSEALTAGLVRDLLILAPTAAPAGSEPSGPVSVPARAAAHPDAAASRALVAMVERWVALRPLINAAEGDEAVDALSTEQTDLQRVIYDHPSASLADLVAKVPVFRDELAEALRGWDGDPDTSLPSAAWLGLFRDLSHLSGLPLPSSPTPAPVLLHAAE